MSISMSALLCLAIAFILEKLPFIGTGLSIAYDILLGFAMRLLSGNGDSEGGEAITLKQELIAYLCHTIVLAMSIGLYSLVRSGFGHLAMLIFIGAATFSLLFWIRGLIKMVQTVFLLLILFLPLLLGTASIVGQLALLLTSLLLVQSVSRAWGFFRANSRSGRIEGQALWLRRIPRFFLGAALLSQTLAAVCFTLVDSSIVL